MKRFALLSFLVLLFAVLLAARPARPHAEGAESDPRAEAAESAEPESHAESAENRSTSSGPLISAGWLQELATGRNLPPPTNLTIRVDVLSVATSSVEGVSSALAIRLDKNHPFGIPSSTSCFDYASRLSPALDTLADKPPTGVRFLARTTVEADGFRRDPFLIPLAAETNSAVSSLELALVPFFEPESRRFVLALAGRILPDAAFSIRPTLFEISSFPSEEEFSQTISFVSRPLAGLGSEPAFLLLCVRSEGLALQPAEPESHAEGAELESHAESAGNAETESHAEAAESAESGSPAPSAALRVEPVSFPAAPAAAAPVIEQSPAPPAPPPEAAPPPPPPPAVFRVGPDWTPDAAPAAARPIRDPADLPTNTCFTAAELAALFDPDDPALSSTNALERAFALDWRDRFAEAWALLREEEARPDADPALLLLAANYRLYGRPGVADLLDPERPGLYRAALQGEARETLRRIVALGADTNAPPRTLYLAARARALLAPETFAEDGAREAETAALLRRAAESPAPPPGAPGGKAQAFHRSLAEEALLRGSFGGLGGFADDPGVLPVGPADRPLPSGPSAEREAGDGADAPAPWDYVRRGGGDTRERAFLCRRRDSVFARRGADGMAELAALFLGADRISREAGHAALAVDPAWGEWWARRAAIRGNAAARAAFDGNRFAAPEAIPDPHAVSRSVRISGGWHPRSPLAGAPGMGAGGWIEPYEETPELAEKRAPFGLRAFWFRRDLPPEGTALGDRIRALNAAAESTDPATRKWANTALPARIPFLLFLPPPAACTGAVPLVVYLPGNGEQGTDLAKQFRQTACIGKVCSAAFQAAHPAALLVPMPPDWGNHNVSDGWPRNPFGPQAELFSDLVLAVARSSQALGGPEIDPARIHLTGLGSGAAIGAGMAFDHPGRFASVSGAWFLPYCEPNGRVPGAWWIAREDKGLDEDEQLEWKETFDRRFKPFLDKVSALGGAAEYREYPPLPGAWWWDRMWRDDDSFWAWMLSRRSDGEIDPEDASSAPRFLFGKSPDAAAASAAPPSGNGTAAASAAAAKGMEKPIRQSTLPTIPAPSGPAEPDRSPMPENPPEAAADAARPPAASDAVFLASLSSDGTAVFWGAETNGAFCPPTFPVAVRFRAGEAGATALSNAVRLVVEAAAPDIPAGAFAGLPALRTAVLPFRARSIGPGAFAGCAALSNVVLRGNAPCEIAADAFAGCSPDLALGFVERRDTARAPWPGGPAPSVRGLGGSGGRLRMDGWEDWAFPGGSARYVGPRVEGACLFRIRADGTADLLRKLDPDAPDPAALDGAPLVPEEELGGRRFDLDVCTEGDFLYRREDGWAGSPRNRTRSAVLVAYRGTNEILRLPDALGGAPLADVDGRAFVGTPVRGLRLPATVRRFDRCFYPGGKGDALEAVWCDGDPVQGSSGERALRLYFPAGRPSSGWNWRAIPAGADVDALLARGADGPPVRGAFEYVPLAAGGAAVTGLAARPEGGTLEIPASLDGLPVVEIADAAFSPLHRAEDLATGRPTPRLFSETIRFWTETGTNGVARGERRSYGDSSPYTNRLAVVVPEGVRRIGARAFECFAPLAALSLPSTLEEIGPRAFASCPLLREVRVPSGVREIPAAAFAGCRALETAAVAGPVERIGPFAFAGCPALRDWSVLLAPAAEVDPWAFFDSAAVGSLPGPSPSGPPEPAVGRTDRPGAGAPAPVDPGRVAEWMRASVLRAPGGDSPRDRTVFAEGDGFERLVRLGAPCGYDLELRDFLPPIGRGEAADFRVRAFRFWPHDSGLRLEGVKVEGADGTSAFYLRRLPVWFHGRVRRVGHLLPPPCAWSATNGFPAGAAEPWRAVDDESELVAPIRSLRDGSDGTVRIFPSDVRYGGGPRIRWDFPVERRPFRREPLGFGWGGPAPERGFLGVGKTADGAACLVGPIGPIDDSWLFDERVPAGFPEAAFVALYDDCSNAHGWLAGVDTLYVPPFVEEIPDRAFENCGDLRCVVLEPGNIRIGARAFAGCTNLAAVLVLPIRSGTGPKYSVSAAPDAFEGCAPDLRAVVQIWPRNFTRPEIRLGLPETMLFLDPTGFRWRETPRGVAYDGPRVLDGWVLSDGPSCFVPVVRPLGKQPEDLVVPETVAGRAVRGFAAPPRSLDGVRTVSFPPGMRDIRFGDRVPEIVRLQDVPTSAFADGRTPDLLFIPPGPWHSSPGGVDVGRTRILPPGADLAAQLAVKWQNRDCGGWLWVPVGDDAAQLVAWRGADPTNGVLALPAFVGPEDRRPDVPDAAAPPSGARRVVAVSPYMFRRHDASTQRERGAKFELVVPEGVETIGAFAFENTLRIERVRLPSTLRSLGEGAFSNCGNLKEVVLPEGVKEIPAGCFLGCAALERVSAPGATNVAALAFAGCERLAGLSLAPGASLHPAALLDTPRLHAEGAE